MDAMERKVDAPTATYLASTVATRDVRPTVHGPRRVAWAEGAALGSRQGGPGLLGGAVILAL